MIVNRSALNIIRTNLPVFFKFAIAIEMCFFGDFKMRKYFIVIKPSENLFHYTLPNSKVKEDRNRVAIWPFIS